MSTSWNKFQHANAGKGYTKAELSKLYKKKMSPRKVRSVGRVSPQKKQVKSLSLTKLQNTLPETRRQQRANLTKIMAHKGEGRGSPTRGWAAASPQRGRERHALLDKCGAKAFLDAKNEKFPVMPALRYSNKCEVSCQGVQAAKNRACQYKYYDIAAKAQAVGARKCGWSPSKRPCNL